MKSAQGLMKNTAEGITSADREAVKFREGLTAVGASATRMGLVAAAGVALVTKAAMDWESAWAGVTKTVDGTPAQLSAIEQGLRSMTGELPATHQELAAIAETAGQLGVQTDSILEFTRVAAMLGTTTDLSATAAAEGLARLMNVMQTAPQDVDRLASTLVQLGNNGASTESQILDMATNLAGAASVVGATEADVLALSNAMASVGIEAEAGGSSVSRILMDMSSAIQTGSDDLDRWASVAGMSVEDFSSAFEDRPIEAFNAFTEGLGRINDEGGNVFGTLQSLGQTDVRVSRALLGMAQSGDLLTESLAMGAAEWKNSTALADEAAKRYETTASETKMAWNEIKDSAIDAGQGMLPVVSAVADSVSTLAAAFGALPGPVKSSVGVIGAVGAAGLLAVGGIAKLANSVADARVALDELSVRSPRYGGAIGRVAGAASRAAVAFAALQTVDQLFGGDDQTKSVKEFADALSGASTSMSELDSVFTASDFKIGALSGFKAEITGLSDAFDALDANWFTKLNNFGASGLGFWETEADLATSAIAKADAELEKLVSSGNAPAAVREFEGIAEAAKDNGMSMSRLAELFPRYSEALNGLADDQGNVGEAAAKSAAKVQDAAARMGMSAEEYTALGESAQATGEAFVGLGDSVDDSSVSMRDWISELEDQAEALAEFTENALQASQRGLDEGLIASLREAGPEGALRMEQLANASESEIGRANAAWRDGASAISVYVESVTGVPASVVSEFSTPGAANAIDTAVNLATKYALQPDVVETVLRALDYSSEQIAAVKARLGDLDGRDATVSVRVVGGAQGVLAGIQAGLAAIPRSKEVTVTTRNQTARADGGEILRAAGGSVLGPGTGTSDSIPAVGPGGAKYRLSNGEHVITAEEVDIMGGQSAVYAWRAALRQQRAALAYAGGGGVGTHAPTIVERGPVKVRLESGALEIKGGKAYVSGIADLVYNGHENYRAGQRRAGRHSD